MSRDASDTSKRQRIAPPRPATLHLNDLPENIFADVASYLPTLPRGMFATAIQAPSSSWQQMFSSGGHQRPRSARAGAILSSLPEDCWKHIDFGDLDAVLAAALRDDDIFAVLLQIDAASSVEVLKLTGCFNITGRGLEPLRHSIVLKQVDLGGDKGAWLPLDVFPVLESILDAGGSSFCHFRFPSSWHRGLTLGVQDAPGLFSFQRKYVSLMRSRHLACLRCNESINEVEGGYIYAGRPSHTCYGCLRHFCGCIIEVDTDAFTGTCPSLVRCSYCMRDLCFDCDEFVDCDFCENEGHDKCSACSRTSECSVCDRHFCHRCGVDEWCACLDGERFCDECAPTIHIWQRNNCGKGFCDRCSQCWVCKKKFCSDCRYLDCSKDLDSACPGCLKSCAPTVITKLQEEHEKEKEELCHEIDKLRRENEVLRGG